MIFENLSQFSKVTFITLVVASRALVHTGYYGLEPDRLLSTVVILGFSVLPIVWTTKTLKWTTFFIIFVPISFSALQLYRLISIGEAVSAVSWVSLTLLAVALVPLSQMPVRQKVDKGTS